MQRLQLSYQKDIDRVINTNLIGTLIFLKKQKDNSKIIFLSSSRVNSIRTISKMFQNHNFKNQIKIKKQSMKISIQVVQNQYMV